jgi:DNA-directed RNA polymerase specialized sigma24 family protein
MDTAEPGHLQAQLAHFGDLTQREIAETLNVPLGTVKAQTARGLRRLGKLLTT